MKDNSIELLDVDLMNDTEKLHEIDHWLRVLNWPNGWHYDLDIIWLLQNIEALNLPKGSTILDAGAGLGVMQFILAARGYNVISLDFTHREIPRFTQRIFTIQVNDTSLGNYTHAYMEWMSYGQKKPIQHSVLSRLKNAFLNPQKAWYVLMNAMKQRWNISYIIEKKKSHDHCGLITFLRGTFNAIPLETGSVDLLISLSAFEHNTYEDMPASVKEFERVLKKDAYMLITTSAAAEKDWYFEPSKGWNFSCQTLCNWFMIAPTATSFDYHRVSHNIQTNLLVRSRIDPFYKYNGNNGLPFAKLEDAQYVPVGIRKRK